MRDVTLRVRRPGLRAIHPGKYIFRSKSAQRESMLRAAWVSPEMFQTGIVRAHLFPLRPFDGRQWDALLAVSFTVPLIDSAGGDVVREFGAMLYDGPDVMHEFARKVTLRPDNPEVISTPTVTFLEPVRLRPGSYTVTAVMSSPDGDPHATKIRVTVPEIPKKELFLIGPMLGRPAGSNLVIMGSGSGHDDDSIGSEKSFEPLLVQQLDDSMDLVAITQACLVDAKKRKKQGKWKSIAHASRALLDTDGVAVGRLEPLELSLEGEGRVKCTNLVDLLPVQSLKDGEYIFEVELDTGRDDENVEPHRVHFFVGESAPVVPDDLSRSLSSS